MTSQPEIELDEHEAEAGEVIPDPWDDDEQTDWPTEKVDPDVEGEG